MTSARWELVTRIFEGALDQPLSARNDFVRRECKGDHELEAEVVRLLAADQQAGSFLERPAFTTVAARSILNSPLSPLATGSVVSDRFEILRFIGQGGMGQVYEALDLELKVRVALKAIRPDISSDPRMLARFRREVQLTRRITHPNVCRTFDIERHSASASEGDELMFLTMELLEGETLADRLRREGRLTTAAALPLVLQMIEALSAAHNVGIIHRDFKPSNMLLVPSDTSAFASLRVVVTDFGLARAVIPDGQISADHAATSLTGNQALMGTLIYMAPEQFERGEATVASDIYSLGLVIYEMVVGARPFADPIPFAEAAKRLKHRAPSARLSVPELDASWEAVIGKCLETAPHDRFQSARDVAEEIGPARSVSSAQSTSRRSLMSPQITPPKRGSWRMWAGIAVLATAVSLISLGLRHYQLRTDAKLAGGATVLLTEIQNSTGDKRFDGTTELVRHQLSQSPYFNLMDAGRIREVLTQMTKPPNTPLDPPTAREVALRTGAPRVIFGAVSRVGDSYVLDLDIEQPDNNPRRSRAQWEKHWTWTMSSVNSDKEIPSAFLSAVRDGSDWIRSEVGEAANDIAREDVPPEDVTTANWEALAEFAHAEKFRAAGQNDSAIIALKNAVAADPHFALAHMRLGDVLVSLSRFSEGYRAYQNALTQVQQQRLTRKEKDRLEGIYAYDTEDFAAAEAAFRDYTAYYPNDYLGWFYRGSSLMMLGRVEEAISSMKRASEIDPEKVFAPGHIARFNLMLGHFDESSKWIQHLREKGHLDDAEMIEGFSDFLQGRSEQAFNQFQQLTRSTDGLYRSLGFSLEARLLAETGQYEQALSSIEEGINSDVASGNGAQRADKLIDRAYIEYKLHQHQKSFQSCQQALASYPSPQRLLAAGTLLGRVASVSDGQLHARIILRMRQIEKELLENGNAPISKIARSRIQGEISLANRDWQTALDSFRKADQLEPPAADREYLARALMIVAQHAKTSSEVTSLRQEALSDYARVSLNPAQVWQLPLAYSPGHWSDELIAYEALARTFGRLDSSAQSNLELYQNLRRDAVAIPLR